MAKKTGPDPLPAPPAPVPVARGEGIVALPRAARREAPSPAPPRKRATGKVAPRAHGRRSSAIGGRTDVGDAFAAWLRDEKGLDPEQRLPATQLVAFGEEFRARPIHGHRRSGSDDHRPNPEHLRK